MKKETGFTLVELAIVLMIIGLLIGGILRGQELIRNSQITATIQQVKAYEGATTTFREAYGMLPGDLSSAATRLAGCTTANSCQSGNADGMIGTPGRAWNGINADMTLENHQFWKHLSLAHLISGVDPSTSAANMKWGSSDPVAKIGGGFNVYQSSTMDAGVDYSSDVGSYNALIIRIQNAITGGPEGNPSVSPKDAAQIDRKMDDGKPYTGDVRSTSTTGPDPLNACEGASYNETVDTKSCVLYFKVAR